MIASRVTELLGIRHPILQGGMAWVSNYALAAAVSEAGGLGIIAAMGADGAYLRDQIRRLRALTEAPFGVNIMLMSPHVEAVAQVALEERVPVITSGAGSPAKYMKSWLDAGIKVVPVVPSVAIARRMERSGASAIIAEGCEAGGHIGELTTMALVPQVVDAVDVPVIAAGGIGDGRGMAAALMLGASGVQMGTRFLAAAESPIHQNYKDKVLSARDIDTQVTGRRLGHPVRALKNPFTAALAAMEYDAGKTNEDIEAFGVGALRRAVIEGDLQNGSFCAGQIAALVKTEQPVAEIIQTIIDGAERRLADAVQWVK